MTFCTRDQLFTFRTIERQDLPNHLEVCPLQIIDCEFDYVGCISVKANGSDIGKGTHVAVYLHMMAGEYDDGLRWPFRGEVTVQLLNQKGNENHHEKALVEAADYLFDYFMECVARVEETQERGLAWGHDTFITHGGLAYNAGKDCQYLKNDCLKFQVNKVVVFDKL